MDETRKTGESGRRFLRRFRATYTNFYKQRAAGEGTVPPGEIKTPAEHPILLDEIPDAARRELEAYRRARPQEEIEFIKYMRSVNGEAELVVEDERDLPGDEQLLVLSNTSTLTTADTIQVITELFVARKT